jgi:hypothetical protein
MTDMQFQRAETLKSRITALKAEDEVWSGATGFNQQPTLKVKSCGHYVNIPAEDFQILRAIRLQKIQSEIKTLTQEFEQL